ncbi:MAG: hypothetical protein JW778_05665 [Candidatus Altiarchaeota archaeon]|nr:hypothetical protein [Candidatus Altiarchaeota archaeon]
MKGQSASFDMVLVLLTISLALAFISGFLNNSAEETQTLRVRDDYTHSLLVSMLRCTINSSQKTFSDLTVEFFQNASLNQTLGGEITQHMNLYAEDRKLDWVVYANGTSLLWVPWEKTLSGKKITSSSTELLLPDNDTVRLYLFIKWG